MNDLLLAESDLFVFIHRTACSVASFGTFVSRTLPYRAYRCTVFSNNSQSLLICRSNERTKKCKSVNLLFFSMFMSLKSQTSAIKMFSLSSLIRRIGKSVVRCCLHTLLVFLPLINGKSVAHLFQTIIQ